MILNLHLARRAEACECGTKQGSDPNILHGQTTGSFHSPNICSRPALRGSPGNLIPLVIPPPPVDIPELALHRPDESRRAFVRVDEALPPRHAGAHPSRVQQRAQHATGGQVHGQGLVDDVQRRLGRTVRVPRTAAVIAHAAHLARHVAHQRAPAAGTPDDAVLEQLLGDQQRAHRVDPEHMRHLVRGHVLQRPVVKPVPARGSRVVYHDVDRPPVVSHGRSGQQRRSPAADGRLVLHVQRSKRQAAGAHHRLQGRQVASVLNVAARGHHGVSLGLRQELLDELEADPAVGARDDDARILDRPPRDVRGVVVKEGGAVRGRSSESGVSSEGVTGSDVRPARP
mmetsp:Transcript_35988/g.89833  ORF Transcript_35988/g.89833 Transcript_35988/m.89833 type:complete len:342 (+) Transcript_35988:151-1176(+)